MSDPHETRIAREEAYWNGPKLITLGFVFLGFCLVLIYISAII
ncbi:MAG: hypothetical protein OXT09_24370 [Myxococcales bacterium]|nr:hypothetical protein [Myxococcales bacterium]